MRISDWSSDVCSSDLSDGVLGGRTITAEGAMMNDTSPIGITVALPGSKEQTEEQTELPVDRAEIDRLARELEQERFAQVEAELHQALEFVPDLSDFAKNLEIGRAIV